MGRLLYITRNYISRICQDVLEQKLLITRPSCIQSKRKKKQIWRRPRRTWRRPRPNWRKKTELEKTKTKLEKTKTDLEPKKENKKTVNPLLDCINKDGNQALPLHPPDDPALPSQNRRNPPPAVEDCYSLW